MEDLLAVLDAVGSEQATLVGASDGGPLAMLFAATHPERTRRLVVINSYACRVRTEGYPWAPTAEEWQGFQEAILESWGPGFLLHRPGTSNPEGVPGEWYVFSVGREQTSE
jgi:pimeloyl-ACP methyl ester carboxylesterase